MAQTSVINPQDEQPIFLDCKTFDVTHGIVSNNRQNGPRRPPSHETLSVAFQGELEISSVAGQAPSLDRHMIVHLDWWQNPQNVLKGVDLHPSRTQHSSVYRRLKRRLGCSLKSRFYQRTVIRSRKIITHKRFITKSSLLGPQTFQVSMSKSNRPGCHEQLNGSCLHQQTGPDSLEMCALLWRIMSWCHRFKISLHAKHIPGCLNVISDPLSRLTQIQSTEWSLHAQVFKRICKKWFTPQVDLFATCLNHKLPLYISPVPDQNARNKHKLVKPCSLCVSNNSSTAQSGTKGPPVQRPPHSGSRGLAGHALVLGSGASIRNFASVICISNSTQIIKPPGVSQQSTVSQPLGLVSRSEQLQEQGLSTEVAERIAAPQRPSTRAIYQAKWALFEKWCRENSVDVSKPSVKQVLLHYNSLPCWTECCSRISARHHSQHQSNLC